MRHLSRGIRKMVSLDSRPPSIANGIIIGIGNLQRNKMRVLLNCSSNAYAAAAEAADILYYGVLTTKLSRDWEFQFVNIGCLPTV